MGKQKDNVQRPTMEEKQTWLETDPISRTRPGALMLHCKLFIPLLNVNCGSALLPVMPCPRSNILAFYSLKLLFQSSMQFKDLIERIVNNSSTIFLSYRVLYCLESHFNSICNCGSLTNDCYRNLPS